MRVKSCAGCEFQGAEPTVAVIVRGIVVNSALVFKVGSLAMKRSLGSHAGAINLNVEIPVADIGSTRQRWKCILLR